MKFTLEQAMKALSTRWVWVVKSTTRPLYHLRKSASTRYIRGGVGPAAHRDGGGCGKSRLHQDLFLHSFCFSIFVLFLCLFVCLDCPGPQGGSKPKANQAKGRKLKYLLACNKFHTDTTRLEMQINMPYFFNLFTKAHIPNNYIFTGSNSNKSAFLTLQSEKYNIASCTCDNIELSRRNISQILFCYAHAYVQLIKSITKTKCIMPLFQQNH